MQFIVFLYLADQNSSWLILGSSLIGTFIEIWKITKVLKLTIKFINRLPKIDIQHRDSTNSETREYDSMAMKYLGYFSIPLVISYSTYSLIYQPHKSWYSWLVNTMVGFVYTFGIYSTQY